MEKETATWYGTEDGKFVIILKRNGLYSEHTFDTAQNVHEYLRQNNLVAYPRK